MVNLNNFSVNTKILKPKLGLKKTASRQEIPLPITNLAAGQRVEDKIKWAIEFLKEYGYEIGKV